MDGRRGDAGQFRAAGDDGAQSIVGEGGIVGGDPQIGGWVLAEFEVLTERAAGIFAEVNFAGLVAFAVGDEDGAIGGDVVDTHGEELGGANAGIEEGEDDGVVADIGVGVEAASIE